jgi:mono/diheme cytochrome c family protein
VAALVGVVLLAAACRAQEQTPETSRAAEAAPVSDPRAAIFVAKGCPQCHSIAALGVKSAAEVGPDLTLAYEDVQNRFGVTLAEFLRNPTGTMQVVLSSTIQLSPAERDSITAVLYRLHEQRQETDEGREARRRTS